METGWQADESIIAEWERRGKQAIFRETLIPAYQLPLVLQGTTKAEWETRDRPQTLAAFAEYVYGQSPATSLGIDFESSTEDRTAFDGRATKHVCNIVIPTKGQPFSFQATVFIPNCAAGNRVPTFFLLNIWPRNATNSGDFWPVEKILGRGFAAAMIHVADVQPDEPEGLTRGVIAAVASKHNWATIAAWAWGASRAMDWLCTLPDIDSKKIAIVGHSRGGKAALWAAAQDQRFAMVISNESGCAGAALSRRRFGETIALINNAFPHWFCEKLKRFNNREDDLPIDQHQLLALIAPRPLYVASADQDLWADPRGEFLALANASRVYELYGHASIRFDEMPLLDQPLMRGPLGYHIRRGSHGLTLYDWEQYLGFADNLWRILS